MRKDTKRVVVKFKCNLFLRKRNIDGQVVSISDGGLRIFTEYSANVVGSILDVIVYDDSIKIITLVGCVINQDSNYLGITIICIDDKSRIILNQLLSNTYSKNVYDYQIRMNQKSRILVLGAGGGKILAQIKMLHNLEQHLGVKLLDYFNVLVGVSSGGLILALLLKYRDITKVNDLIEENLDFKSWNLFPFFSFLNTIKIEKFIVNEFQKFKIGSDHILYLQYLDYLSGNYESLLYQNSDVNLIEPLLKSISVPVIFGLFNNYSDGAVGFFINPTELCLRILRMRVQLESNKLFILYLDSGFDPKINDKNKLDILSQLLWTLRMNQRDSILVSIDRILNEFEEINLNSYLFTYSKNFDLFNSNDMKLAVLDIESKKDEFISWLHKIEIGKCFIQFTDESQNLDLFFSFLD